MRRKNGVGQAESLIPGEARLTINSTCNQRCLFCGPQRGPSLTAEAARRTLDRLRRTHPEATALIITGGEPTLSPALVASVRHAKKLGFHDMMMTTNGVRLADAAFCDELREAGLGRLNFSMHTTRSATFDRITRTKGFFPKVMKGLENAATRFDILANMVINRHNHREVPAMVRFLSKLQARTDASLRLMPSIVVIEEDPARSVVPWENISISNTRIVPYLAEAVRFDRAQPRPVIMAQFGGLSFMPLCACREHPELLAYAPRVRFTESIGYMDGDGRVPPEGVRRVKAASCRSCRLDAACPGVAPGYAALYGLSELVPL